MICQKLYVKIKTNKIRILSGHKLTSLGFQKTVVLRLIIENTDKIFYSDPSKYLPIREHMVLYFLALTLSSNSLLPIPR